LARLESAGLSAAALENAARFLMAAAKETQN
jgi:hypothetical protein